MQRVTGLKLKDTGAHMKGILIAKDGTNQETEKIMNEMVKT